jgi:peptidyl-Lys metalloendopeptidase
MVRFLSLAALPALAFAGHVTTMHQVTSLTAEPTAEVLVEFEVTAEGDISYEVQFTPFEGLYDAVLTVVDNTSGESLPYKGKVARRVEGLDTLVHIGDGGYISHTVDLAASYDLESHGSYTVGFDSAEIVVVVGDLMASQNATDVDAFMTCSSSQNSQIATAENQAASQVSSARNNLGRGVSSQYTEWFGSHTSSRFNKVVSDFGAINNNIRRSRYACDPSCPGVYAYVYPSDSSQTIYMCDVFWQIPNERAETIVHEVSHFNRIAGTNDWAYGQNNCRNLARNDPNRAVDNADNMCYFGKFA